MSDLDIIIDTYLHGDVSNLNYLLFTIPDINEINDDGETLLTWACRSCAVPLVDKLLSKNLIDVNKKNIWEFSPLSLACHANSAVIVELLLEKGANVNIPDHNGDYPLTIAYKRGSLDIMRLLLEHEADMYTASSNEVLLNSDLESILNSLHVYLEPSIGFSFMHKACNENNVDVINFLIQKYGDRYIHEADDNGLYPIHYACMNEAIDAVRILLQHGANPNVRSNKGFYPIGFACMVSSYDLVEYLVDNGASVNVSDRFYNTPLMYACITSSTSIARLLIEHQADVNICNVSGFTPLMSACKSNNLSLVNVLLDAKADVNRLTSVGFNALYFAAINNADNIIKLLMSHGSTPLFLSRNGDLPLVKNLLNNNDPKVRAVVALHSLDSVSFRNALESYQQRHGVTDTSDFAMQLKSTKDYKFCMKLNRNITRNLNSFIWAKNIANSHIASANSTLHKFNYMNNRDLCLEHISKQKKKLSNIKALLKTPDDFIKHERNLA